MKHLSRFLLLALLVLPLQAHAQGPNLTWFQCRADSDCVAINSDCGVWQGVNKNFLAAYKAILPKLNCAPSSAAQTKAMSGDKPRCLNGECSIASTKSQ